MIVIEEDKKIYIYRDMEEREGLAKNLQKENSKNKKEKKQREKNIERERKKDVKVIRVKHRLGLYLIHRDLQFIKKLQSYHDTDSKLQNRLLKPLWFIMNHL